MAWSRNLILSLICFCSFTGKAQILNTERFRLDADSAKIWMGVAEFGFSAKKQQTDVFTLSSKANTAYLSKKHSYMFLGFLNLVKVANTNVISEGYGHIRFNFFRKKLFSLEQFNQWQFDQGRGMNSRGLIGSNVRFRVKSTDKWEFALNSGLMYEDEIWENSEGNFISNVNLKSSSSATVRFKINEIMSFLMISYYQARFDRFFTPRFITDASFQLSLTSKFALRAQYTATYDADPIINISKLIYSINNTLVYKF